MSRRSLAMEAEAEQPLPQPQPPLPVQPPVQHHPAAVPHGHARLRSDFGRKETKTKRNSLTRRLSVEKKLIDSYEIILHCPIWRGFVFERVPRCSQQDWLSIFWIGITGRDEVDKCWLVCIIVSMIMSKRQQVSEHLLVVLKFCLCASWILSHASLFSFHFGLCKTTPLNKSGMKKEFIYIYNHTNIMYNRTSCNGSRMTKSAQRRPPRRGQEGGLLGRRSIRSLLM